MPLYPYRCTKCGFRFEKIQKYGDEPVKLCPECGGMLERPLTAPGLQFKGAGWYVNDYASKGGSSSSDSATAEKKPETKPETKTTSGGESSASSPASTSPAASSSTPSSSSTTS